MTRHIARLAASFAAVLALVIPAHTATVRYDLTHSVTYTYGPFDEIRLDMTYVPSPDGRFDAVPTEGFTELSTVYEYLSEETAPDGTVTVTYRAADAVPEPSQPSDLENVTLFAASAAVLAPAAVLLAGNDIDSPAASKSGDKHFTKETEKEKES